MDGAECRVVVERYYDEVMNQHRLTVLDEILPIPPAQARDGFAGETREICEYLLAAFPDLHFTVREWICAPGCVVTRWTARGTHLGVFMDNPATHRAFLTSGIDIFHLENGKITSIWQEMNTLNLLQQLDILPSPVRPGGAHEKGANP